MSVEPLTGGDPRQVGPFRLLSRLGEGGMGRVYLGRSAGGRTVAVKMVHSGMLGMPGFRERFAREVRASQAVSGTGTVPVVAADPDAEVPWLASAYVPGPSLAEAVARYGPLPPASLWRLLAGLVEALGSVQAAGLVHRDLKPSNVLLSLDRPRLIDFGIARAADDSGLTRTGAVIGSPGYMSPEQVQGQQLTAASDVFSLGAVLAFAATGQSPFGDATGVQMLFRLVHDEPDLTGVPEPLAPVVRACLAKRPELRPSLNDLHARAAAEAGGGADGRSDWLPAPIAAAIARKAEELLNLDVAEDAPAQAAPAEHPAPATQPGFAATPAPGPGPAYTPGPAHTPVPGHTPAPGHTPVPQGFGEPTRGPWNPYGTPPPGGGPTPSWPGAQTTNTTPPPPRRRRGPVVAAVAAAAVLVAGILVVANLGGGDEEPGGGEGPSGLSATSDAPTQAAEGTAAVAGEWNGSYTCAQGETGLTLTIEEAGGDALTATFAFAPLPSNPDAEQGSFAMTGTLAGGRLDLRGDRWIDQPGSYLMVDLTAPYPGSDPNRIEGTVDSAIGSCSTFTVTR